MTILEDVQAFEPGKKIVVYILDGTELGAGMFYFHANSDQPLVFQGQTYDPWPIKAEGFSRTAEQQPVPKLSVGNTDGSISILCQIFDDMVGAKLTRKVTFEKYIDAINFPPGEHLTADPNEEFPPEIWYIERKALEVRESVEFELSSPLNFQGVRLPRRVIIANQCSFKYRGPYCAYIGPPVATKLNVPTSDPLLDDCSRTIGGCKLRQWPDNILNFGGCPAAGLIRT